MKYQSTKSFSLIELLITIFILAIGIVGILSAFPLGGQLENSAKMATVATQLAQAKIEEIISKPYDDIRSETKQTLDSPFSAYSRETEITYFNPDNPEVIPTEDMGIKKIKVTVFWKSPLGASSKKVEIFSLIAKR